MSTPFPPARNIGKYQVMGVLGRGGFGVVYSALDLVLNRRVAIKSLLDITADEGELRREAEILAALQHENIVAVIDILLWEGRLFVVMEYVDGVSLTHWRAGNPEPLARLLILEQVAAAVGSAHASSVQHRDLKPGNIIVTANGKAKVLDFGIAKRRDALGGRLDPSSALRGTLSYLAPEQLTEGVSSYQSDVFAFGVVACELLLNRHPFPGDTEFLIQNAIVNLPHPPLEGVSTAVRLVLDRCLAKDRASRYPSMQEVERDLRRAVTPLRQTRAAELAEQGIESLRAGARNQAESLLDAAEKLDRGCSAVIALHNLLTAPPPDPAQLYNDRLQQCRTLLDSPGPDSLIEAQSLLASLVRDYGWNEELQELDRQIYPPTVVRTPSSVPPPPVEPTPVPSPPVPLPVVDPEPRRWPIFAGGSALLLLAGGLLGTFFRPGDPPPLPVQAPVTNAGNTREWRDGILQRWIPAGAFRMGCSPADQECDENELPTRDVPIKRGFWLQEHEVTQAAFTRIMGHNPSSFRGEQLPVEQVTWQEAQSYCQQVGLRLPGEAEWEYAARGGVASARYGELDSIAWHGGNSGGQTREVKAKTPNAFSLYDLLGNVAEWVENSYDPPNRTVRGGSWSYGASFARASFRFGEQPGKRNSYIGFRCAGD